MEKENVMNPFTIKTVACGCFLLTFAVFAQRLNSSAASAVSPAASAASAPAANAPAQKQPGVVRIGIAEPKFNMGPQASLTAGEPIRTAEAQLLTGPKIEIVKLAALLPAQALAEAKQLMCDYVLNSSVSQKSKSSFGGLGGIKALSMVANKASVLPRVGAVAGGVAGLVTMQAAESATLAMMSAATSSVKAKSEVTFEYSLDSLAGENVVKDAQKAKANADGQDVITPLVQQAASKILALINN